MGKTITVCEWSEVNKLLSALSEKYKGLLCEPLPYEPKTFEVELFAKKVNELEIKETK